MGDLIVTRRNKKLFKCSCQVVIGYVVGYQKLDWNKKIVGELFGTADLERSRRNQILANFFYCIRS